MAWIVLNQVETTFPEVYAVLRGVPLSILLVLLGYGLRESVRGTARAALAGVVAVLPAAIALLWLVAVPAWQLAGLLFAPTFVAVLWRDAAGRSAGVTHARSYPVALFSVAAIGLLPSVLFVLLGLGVFVGGSDTTTVAGLYFLGYGATGVLVDGYVCLRILRDEQGRDLVGRAAETLR